MAEDEGNVLKRTAMRIVAAYKSLNGMVVRASIATLLGTGDQASDLYTTVQLFWLGHYLAAYSMVAMISLSMAMLVRATCAPHRGVCRSVV
jgi:hypothetical protein